MTRAVGPACLAVKRKAGCNLQLNDCDQSSSSTVATSDGPTVRRAEQALRVDSTSCHATVA